MTTAQVKLLSVVTIFPFPWVNQHKIEQNCHSVSQLLAFIPPITNLRRFDKHLKQDNIFILSFVSSDKVKKTKQTFYFCRTFHKKKVSQHGSQQID